MKRLFATLILAAALFGATPVFAQSSADNIDQPTVEIVAPSNWTRNSLKPDDVRIASFVDPKTSNSIEVIGKQIIRPEFKDALFQTFDKKLQEASLTVVDSATQERTFELNDGTSRTGTWKEYSFTSDRIKISVLEYYFISQNYVVIIVGYFSANDRESGLSTMEEFIKTVTDKKVAAGN